MTGTLVELGTLEAEVATARQLDVGELLIGEPDLALLNVEPELALLCCRPAGPFGRGFRRNRIELVSLSRLEL